jgi:hypothetical protein
MKRKTGEFFLLFIFASLAFSGCFSPWKGSEATLTLFLGNTDDGGQRTTASDNEILSHLVHIIELDGPVGRQSHTVEGARLFSVTVMPGYWHISVRALLNSTLYARGEGGAELKAGQDNNVDIKMEQVIKDKLILVTDGSDDIGSAGPRQGSLRYALENIPPDEENITIMVMLPPGSEIKLQRKSLPIDISSSITIEGNGITLSKSDEWDDSMNDKRLMTIFSVSKIIIRRVHFKDSDEGAINNRGTLSLESCIFSCNQLKYGSGGAIENDGPLTVKGCTFYDNSAASNSNSMNSGGAIYNSGRGQIKELIGNLFSKNIADALPVIDNMNNQWNIDFCDYNAVDVELGTDRDKSGWNPGLNDKSFATDIQLIDKKFNPAPVLNSIVPKDLKDFPTTDFYGNNRTSGAPGAVN